MAAASVEILESEKRLGVSALKTDIQTWLTANATGVIRSVLFVVEVYVAVLEVPATV